MYIPTVNIVYCIIYKMIHQVSSSLPCYALIMRLFKFWYFGIFK